MRLYEYLSDEESQLLTYEAVADHKIMETNLELDKLMLEHSVNIARIDTKVLLESGTEDDLVTLYMAEAEETAAKGKGLLSRLCSFIGNLFRRLKNWLFKKSADDSEDKEVNCRASDLRKRSNSLFGQIGPVLKGLAITAASSFVGAAFSKAGGNFGDKLGDKRVNKKAVKSAEGAKNTVYKIRKEDVKKELEDHQKLIDTCINQIKVVENEITKAYEKNLKPETIAKLKEILNEIKGVYKDASEAVGKLVVKDSSKSGDASATNSGNGKKPTGDNTASAGDSSKQASPNNTGGDGNNASTNPKNQSDKK